MATSCATNGSKILFGSYHMDMDSTDTNMLISFGPRLINCLYSFEWRSPTTRAYNRYNRLLKCSNIVVFTLNNDIGVWKRI